MRLQQLVMHCADDDELIARYLADALRKTVGSVMTFCAGW